MTPDAGTIARIARVAVADENADIGTWVSAPLAWVAIAQTTAELARYSGTTTDGRPWSAVRKVLRRPEASTSTSWRREADVYASGILDDLPPGIVAPRLYAIDGADEVVSLWLEEVVESVPVWPLARYARAARDLGRFNGAYLVGHPVPRGIHLDRDWLSRWVAGASTRGPAILDDATVVGHELVRTIVSPSIVDRIRALYDKRAQLLDLLAGLPVGAAHLDAWRANLLARDGAGGEQTVAIDWSVLGLAPAGQEIAVFVTGAQVWLGVSGDDAEALGELSYRAYVDGLRDAGWGGSEADVRFAYAASAALWAVTPTPLWLRWFTLPDRRDWLERKFGMPLERAARPFGRFIEFALDLGEEAMQR
ncbi:MAG TPA: hypothetical protein VM052_09135 [Candidatus Limnocylindrales bacterium]|nr:hypothetical protein [Candidatus Limnocylindrales bacterium]